MAFKPSELLGAKLTTKGSEQADTDAALAGVKYLALYFSAHWCPPCRRFTPMLGDYYEKHGAAKGFEVLFVSSDNSAAEFESYFSEHKWKLAVPFGAADVRGKLSRKYGVKGIPTLVIVDLADGSTVTTEAVQEVASDESGAGFPYRQKSVWELLGEAGSVVDKAGASTSIADLRASADVVGLYFSAHWCGPCRAFTPQLAQWYTDTVAAAAGTAGKPKLDIVFVSSDRDPASFNTYLSSMPWKALPFDARAVKASLSSLFNVEGIPTLVFVRTSDGSLLTANGREKVAADPTGFPWPPAACDSLAAAAGDYINDVPVAVLFVDTVTDASNEAAAVAAFTAVAEETFAAAGGKPSDDIRFAVAREGDEAIDTVRRFLGPGHMKDRDGPTAARLTIINVAEGAKAVWNGGALGVPSADDVRTFVADFLAGKAAVVPIKA